MLFASLTFLLGFLPVVIAGTSLIRKYAGVRPTLGFLCGASFVFYGWHFPPYIVLLLGSIGVNYIFALSLHRAGNSLTITCGVALNLVLLGWFKYAGFLAELITAVSGNHIGLAQIILPLGISFFTFQQIAYLVDIHQGKAKPGDLLEYVFFISFFPQLIAGPIVHHRGFIAQLSDNRFAMFHSKDIVAGTLLFCIGLAKKVLVADSLAPGADVLFTTQELGIPISMVESWFGMLCYTFQIYFDFSGYTDMALGLGLIFGLTLPQNFRSPYKSRNIIEFWRRWNITLSTFLRDYLYFPLGGNKRGPVRRYANLWAVMLLGGLWHGAGLQFLVWGALHGFYLTVNHWWQKHQRRPFPAWLGYGITFVAVIIAWVFFRANDVGQAFDLLTAMAGLQNVGLLTLAIFDDLTGLMVTLAVAAALAFGAPSAHHTAMRLVTTGTPSPRLTAWYAFAGILAACSLFPLYSSGSYAFIYFQF